MFGPRGPTGPAELLLGGGLAASVAGSLDGTLVATRRRDGAVGLELARRSATDPVAATCPAGSAISRSGVPAHLIVQGIHVEDHLGLSFSGRSAIRVFVPFHSVRVISPLST